MPKDHLPTIMFEGRFVRFPGSHPFICHFGYPWVRNTSLLTPTRWAQKPVISYNCGEITPIRRVKSHHPIHLLHRKTVPFKKLVAHLPFVELVIFYGFYHGIHLHVSPTIWEHLFTFPFASNLRKSKMTRWWQLKYVLFSPLSLGK